MATALAPLVLGGHLALGPLLASPCEGLVEGGKAAEFAVVAIKQVRGGGARGSSAGLPLRARSGTIAKANPPSVPFCTQHNWIGWSRSCCPACVLSCLLCHVVIMSPLRPLVHYLNLSAPRAPSAVPIHGRHYIVATFCVVLERVTCAHLS